MQQSLVRQDLQRKISRGVIWLTSSQQVLSLPDVERHPYMIDYVCFLSQRFLHVVSYNLHKLGVWTMPHFWHSWVFRTDKNAWTMLPMLRSCWVRNLGISKMKWKRLIDSTGRRYMQNWNQQQNNSSWVFTSECQSCSLWCYVGLN